MKERLNVTLTQEKYEKLERRLNFFSTSRTQMIYLHLFLYQEATLTEREIKDSLLEIDFDENSYSFTFMANDYFLNIFKKKQRYLFSLNEYVSVFLNILLENDETFEGMELDAKQEKKKSMIHMQDDIAEWVQDFSKRTGLSKAVFTNYALCQNLDNVVISSNTIGVREGFYLPLSTDNYLKQFDYDKRVNVLHNHIKAFKNIAE
ncbi:hypothetical protein B795N_14850 [Marinilactibacillus psychrotolerans]|nr:hypothetical protein B795N_14850 [Marinilactibacillus psychrotolerans]